jgi:hypothetical protein
MIRRRSSYLRVGKSQTVYDRARVINNQSWFYIYNLAEKLATRGGEHARAGRQPPQRQRRRRTKTWRDAMRSAARQKLSFFFFALLGVMACACRLEWEWKHSSSSDAERHRTNQLHVMAHILEPIRGLSAHRLASGVRMILVTSTSSSVGFVVAVRACVRGRRRRSPQVCRVQASPAAAGAHSHHHMHRG